MVKVEQLLKRSAPSRHGHRRGAQVHGAHQAASHVPVLYMYLPSCSRYSFTDPERMEGWVSPGPGCKEQLAHGCYTTVRSQRTRTRDLAAAGRARYGLSVWCFSATRGQRIKFLPNTTSAPFVSNLDYLAEGSSQQCWSSSADPCQTSGSTHVYQVQLFPVSQL